MSTSSATENAVNRAMALAIKGAIGETGKVPEDLVDSTGISKSTFYNKFRGGKGFTFGEVYAIAQVLGTSPYELMRRADDLIARSGVDAPLFED